MSVKCIMILGDCLAEMQSKSIPVVDLVVADIPWGTTKNAFDKKTTLLPPERTKTLMRSIISDRGQIILMASPLAAIPYIQAPGLAYRYDLVYEKHRVVGYLNANRCPLRSHEMMWVFGSGVYNAQKTAGRPYRHGPQYKNSCYDMKHQDRFGTVSDGARYPRSVQKFSLADNTKRHPTQKPVALLDWLIRTYSNPGDNVLDPVSGSFTTCVSACLNGRSSVGIEKDPNYFEAGVERVRKCVRDNNLDVRVEVRR